MSTPITHINSVSSTASSASKRSMSIPMPPNNFIHPSPAVSYVLAASPAPTQNPHNSSWLPHSFHLPGHGHRQEHEHENEHDHNSLPVPHNHGFHIATPHPIAAATSFMDKHVPLFAKHHAEFSYGHAARTAKREARNSLVESPIPEVDVEELAKQGARAAATEAAHAQQGHEQHPSWSAMRAAREAAEMHRQRSGSDSGEEKSPAITP